MKVGIMGCGVISNTYMRDIKELYPEIEVVACADVSMDRVRELAAKYQIKKPLTPEELLKDGEAELIINLTPPKMHYELNLKILRAGKHLFCEKPIAITLEQVLEIKALAKEKGLEAAAAPDTFLGAGICRTRALLDQGAVGDPLYITANMMSFGVETWHPAPEQFYMDGAGPLYDMGPYYLAAMVTMFGRIRRIRAVCATGQQVRKIYSQGRAGETFSVQTPTYYTAILEMEAGITATLTVSFDIWHSTLPHMEIYGTDGTITVPDPNMTDGMPVLHRKEEKLKDFIFEDEWNRRESFYGKEQLTKRYPSPGEYRRGAGVNDMIFAIREKRRCRAGIDLAVHIVEAICGIMEASENGVIYEMKTGHNLWQRCAHRSASRCSAEKRTK